MTRKPRAAGFTSPSINPGPCPMNSVPESSSMIRSVPFQLPPASIMMKSPMFIETSTSVNSKMLSTVPLLSASVGASKTISNDFAPTVTVSFTASLLVLNRADMLTANDSPPRLPEAIPAIPPVVEPFPGITTIAPSPLPSVCPS